MLQKLVQALNIISTPILAVIVICMGCCFAVVSKFYGLDGNTAAGIVGAGIGLLTGQVLSSKQSLNTPSTISSAEVPTVTTISTSPVATEQKQDTGIL
jgi:hypothetical protein